MSLYLDNAATTKISDEVFKEMSDTRDLYANSESKFYSLSQKVNTKLLESRKTIATCLGCSYDEVVFTSGATESNNLVLKGLAELDVRKKTIIISSIEHSSIYNTCQYLKSNKYNIIEVPVDSTGQLDLEYLDDITNSDVLLVSIILVNNEIGTLQNLEKLNLICRKHSWNLHVDATQAIGKVNIDMSRYDSLKFLTMSGHKIYGPKGIGALIIRKTDSLKTPLRKQLHGGHQEYDYRSGTLPNMLIFGFAKACEIACSSVEANQLKLKKLEDKFILKMKKKFGAIFKVNNNFPGRIYGILNCQFTGINNMLFLKKISSYISASTGSACSIDEPSRVLKAIGLSDSEISNSIRFSFSSYLDLKELDIIDII